MEPEDEDCGEYWPIEERMVEHGSKDDMDSDYEEKPKFKNGKPVRKAAAKSALLTKLSIPVVVKKTPTNQPDPKKKEFFFYFPQEEPRDLNKPFQCPKCTRGFRTTQEYRLHCHRHALGTEDYSRAFICDKCEVYETGCPKELASHKRDDCEFIKRSAHQDAVSKITYFCAICSTSFDGCKDLMTHLRLTHPKVLGGEEEVSCPTCGSHFLDKNLLRRHKEGEGPYHVTAKCAYCPDLTFDTWSEHKEHLDKFHEGVLKHQCGHCGVNYFNTELEKVNHKTMCKVKVATHSLPQYPDGKDITCTMCFEKVANNVRDVRAHMTQEHAALGESCTICKDVFFSKKGITNHMKAVHMKTFNCDKCDKVFASTGKLRAHQITHTTDRDFICGECGKGFQTLDTLKRHEKGIHRGFKSRLMLSEKIIHCEKCGKGIKEKRMHYHRRVCQDEANFKCDQCDERFKSRNHMMHHKNRYHVFLNCKHCGIEVSKGNMRSHVLHQHTAQADMPFKCGLCPKGFVDRMKYQDHMNTHTGERRDTCANVISWPLILLSVPTLKKSICSALYKGALRHKQKACNAR